MEPQKLEKDPIKGIGLKRYDDEESPKKTEDRARIEATDSSEETTLNTSGAQEGPEIDNDDTVETEKHDRRSA